MPKNRRIDLELVARGLFESREKAKVAIMAGEIWIGGHRVEKSSQTCAPDVEIECRGAEKYVSRGGYKLEGGLDAFKIDPLGLTCLDLGSSTGGFTDCLLQRGAAKVVCVDVGEGQLHWKLRQDKRVEVREGINARHLKPTDFPELFPLVVGDLSFISLRLVLPAAFDLVATSGWVCVLVKPQFEAGREQVGKGGIVKDAQVHEEIKKSLEDWAKAYPVKSLGMIPSPLKGRDGNQEYLWGLRKV